MQPGASRSNLSLIDGRCPGLGARARPAGVWIEQRLVVLTLLRGSEGARYAHVRGLTARAMTRLAWRYMTETQGEAALSPLMPFVLERTFTRTIDTIADTLGQYGDGPSIQAAIDLVGRYQLAGLLMAPKHRGQGGPRSQSSE